MAGIIFTSYRNEFSPDTTISDCIVDGVKICDILEDVDRGLKQSMTEGETAKIKVMHNTAIGYGSYQVVITKSAKFGIHYPLLLGTVGFVGIRVHCGVNKHHTSGCLLTGMKRIKDGLQRSGEAFDMVFEKMLAHKTDPATAKQLITIHQQFRKTKDPKLADQFAAIYNPKSNANNITWIIEKSNAIISR
jgi:hypothetical protein